MKCFDMTPQHGLASESCKPLRIRMDRQNSQLYYSSYFLRPISPLRLLFLVLLHSKESKAAEIMALKYLTNFIASEAFKTAGRELRDGVPRLVKFVCCLKLTNTYLCTVVLTYGPSMLPTFGLAGNLSLAERISTRFEKLGVGDIVLLRSPEVPKKIVTKRLVATEGQSVSYIVDPKNSDGVETVVVPKGHVWVQGDNIYDSNDSRKFGAVPYGLLQGRVFWRFWPPKDFGSLAQSKGKAPVS